MLKEIIMDGLFQNSNVFYQDLSSWDVSKIEYEPFNLFGPIMNNPDYYPKWNF